MTKTGTNERLTELYPGIPVLCITPIYKNVKKEELDLLIEYSGVIKEICSNFGNVTVIDGFKLVGHAQEYFVDAAHPNTLGSEVYGRNLAETIRKLYLILFALHAKYFIFMENIGISLISRRERIIDPAGIMNLLPTQL